MGKKISDAVLDAALNHIKNNVTTMVLTDAEPASRSAALSGALVSVPVSSGDITLSDGVSGRQLTVATKIGQTVSVGGNYNHVSLISATDLLITTVPPATKTLNGGDTVDVPSWNFRINDPA